LPPVQESCQLYPFDPAVNAEAQKEPVEVRLYGPPSHVELPGNFRVVAALQQQFSNLFFTRTQPDSVLVHPKSSPS
jgi:hypothetical protein